MASWTTRGQWPGLVRRPGLCHQPHAAQGHGMRLGARPALCWRALPPTSSMRVQGRVLCKSLPGSEGASQAAATQQAAAASPATEGTLNPAPADSGTSRSDSSSEASIPQPATAVGTVTLSGPGDEAVDHADELQLDLSLEEEDDDDGALLQDLTALNISDQRFSDILFPPSSDLLSNRAITATLIDVLHGMASNGSSMNGSSSSNQDAGTAGTASGGSAAAGQQGSSPAADIASLTVRVSGPPPEHRQPRTSGFCFNCCAPLEAEPLQLSSCHVCGADPQSQHLLQPDQAQEAAVTAPAAAAFTAARSAMAGTGLPGLAHTLLVYQEEGDQDAAMLQHCSLLPPAPERPERVHAAVAQLKYNGLLDLCERLPVQQATDAELLAVHSQELLDAVAGLERAAGGANQLPAALQRCLGEDMLGNHHSHTAARQAAGSAAELARKLVFGCADNGLALLRPPGHLASRDTAEGGSYFNNAAVAARAAQAVGAQRIMIIDWDVHHCKGTSSIFAEDPDVLVVSVHRYGDGFFPGTGAPEDVGSGPGQGRTVNVGWAPPMVRNRRGRLVPVEAELPGDADYLAVWQNLVLPLAYEFEPEIIIVSAGFDAAAGDPIGGCHVSPSCFGHLTALLRPVARLALLLEGGYNLEATTAASEACLRALLGQRPRHLSGARPPSLVGWNSLLRTMAAHQPYWGSLGMLRWLEMVLPAAGRQAPPKGVPAEEYELEEDEDEDGADWEEDEDEEEMEDEEVFVEAAKQQKQEQQPLAAAGEAAGAAADSTSTGTSAASASSVQPTAAAAAAPAAGNDSTQKAVAAAELAAKLLSQRDMALPVPESSKGTDAPMQQGDGVEPAAGGTTVNLINLYPRVATQGDTDGSSVPEDTSGGPSTSSSSSNTPAASTSDSSGDSSSHQSKPGSSGSSSQQLASADGSLTIDLGAAAAAAPAPGAAGQPLPAELARSTERIKEVDASW